MAKTSSRKSKQLKKRETKRARIPIPAHGGKEQWLEKQRDAVNRQAGKDDFWRNLLGSTSEVAVAATTIARGNEERNAKGTRRVARRGKKRRGAKRRGTKRR